MKSLLLKLWLAKKFGDWDAVLDARWEIRRFMWQNLICKEPGKGNRWLRRYRQMEIDFRKSGGFYLSDFI